MIKFESIFVTNAILLAMLTGAAWIVYKSVNTISEMAPNIAKFGGEFEEELETDEPTEYK